MLTGITTRTSTPQEDAEPWPAGSARPVLDYLTATLGMTGTDARELLTAARTAQAGAGPGTLADYPVPGGDAHLLIHYAPGSRAYRFKLTAPGENEVPPGANREPGTAPGNQPGPDGPPGGRETPDGSPAGDAGGAPAPALAEPPGTRLAPCTPLEPPAEPDPARIESTASLLAIIPCLLGFEPADSMVVIGTHPCTGQIMLTLRYDLPDPPDPYDAADITAHAIGILTGQHAGAAFAVGYGPGPLVTPLAGALRAAAPHAGLEMREILRVQDKRYWSCLRTGHDGGPAEGTPFGTASHLAAMLTAGGTRVLAGREELAASVAAFGGAAGESMVRATRRAEQHAARLITQAAESGQKAPARRPVAEAGLDAVATAIGRYRRSGRPVTGPEAAWLTVVLRDLRVRDDAWARMDPAHQAAHLRLWTDLTRRARPGYVPAPASLLAFVAWQSGEGALANVALDRALADDPQYSMAVLLRQVISSGAPPSMARLPMTPEQVAASYGEEEDGT